MKYIACVVLCFLVVSLSVYGQKPANKELRPTFGSVNFEQTSPCVSPETYAKMDLQRASLKLPAETHQASLYPQYAWPLERPLHNGIILSQYVDDDGTPGIKDYMGLPHSYDGHLGTDLCLYSFREMDEGVEVRAAADGVVVGTEYNQFDRNIDWLSTNPNYVYVQHADLTYAIYLHLRTSSVAVNIGEAIHAGQLVGLVGSSGKSDVAHLHFETGTGIHRGVRDPWNGTQNTLASLWQNQEPYVGTAPLRIYDIGVGTQAAVGGDFGNVTSSLLHERISEPAEFGLSEPYVMIWFMPQGNLGDLYTLTVKRANGSIYSVVNNYALQGKTKYGWHWWYWNFAGNVSPSDYGTWNVEITSGATMLAQHSFQVGPTTAFAPRFLPLAGRSLHLTGSTLSDILRVSSLGGSVTYSLLNAPPYVSLLRDSIVVIDASANPLRRSSYFQAVATDGNGRRDTMRYHVINPNTRPLTLTKTDVLCNGSANGTIMATFGSGPGYFIRLNGGSFVSATTPYVFSNLGPGSYTVTIKDVSDSTETASISLTEPTVVTLSLSKTDAVCNGSSTGSITATFGGGFPGYLAKLDGGAFGVATSPRIFLNLVPGKHTVTIKDTYNCLKVDSIQIDQPAAMTLALSKSDVVCYGGNNGSITVSFDTGSGYTIRLDNGSFVSAITPYTFSGLVAGKHIVTLKNLNNCTKTDSAQLNQPNGISLALAKTDPTTLTSNDGTVTATFSGGTPGYSISLNHGTFADATSPHTFSNLPNGLYYTVIVKDTVNCERTDSILVNLLSTVECQLGDRWNLVSVPLTMYDYHIDSLFPNATRHAFRYDHGVYRAETTMANDVGYWIKSLGAHTVTMQGILRNNDTMIVAEGWNLIGSHFRPVAVKDILSDLPGIITSPFYGYDNGYFVSDTIQPGKAYWVKVNQDGRLILSTVPQGLALNPIGIATTTERPPVPPGTGNGSGSVLPQTYGLEQNYPNPFNPATVVRYQLPFNAAVRLSVFNVFGQEVARLVDEMQDAGYKQVEWNAGSLASSVYIYKLTAGDYHSTKKMILLK